MWCWKTYSVHRPCWVFQLTIIVIRLTFLGSTGPPILVPRNTPHSATTGSEKTKRVIWANKVHHVHFLNKLHLHIQMSFCRFTYTTSSLALISQTWEPCWHPPLSTPSPPPPPRLPYTCSVITPTSERSTCTKCGNIFLFCDYSNWRKAIHIWSVVALSVFHFYSY